MSDAVWQTLITTVGLIAIALLQIVGNIRLSRNTRQTEETKDIAVAIEQKALTIESVVKANGTAATAAATAAATTAATVAATAAATAATVAATAAAVVAANGNAHVNGNKAVAGNVVKQEEAR